MKKLIFSAAVLASAFFAASCQQEMLEPQAEGNTVTYTVEVPEVATKAIGDGNNVDQLIYAVYRVTGETEDAAKTTLQESELMYQKEVAVIEGKAIVPLELIKDQSYLVLFWAQVENKWFGVDYKFGTAGVRYPSTYVPNSDDYAAFSNVDYISVDGSVKKSITLTRPFGQLNIATNLPDPNLFTPVITGTQVTVEGAANYYDVATGKGIAGTLEFASSAPITSEDFTGYNKYISMNYVFVPDQQATVAVSYVITTESHGTVDNTISNVPVKKNYKTNIVGKLLTSDVDYNVTLEKEWAGAEITVANTIEAVQAALDSATDGDIIQLQPGVNYGTLIFRKTASSTVVDITDAGGDEPGNEKYRRIEDLTIIGAEGAIVDGFDFQAGWIPGSGASYIDIKNLTVKNVTFSGNMTPFKFEGFALGIDGLNIVDCKMNDANNNDRFVFQQMNGYKDLNDKSTNEYVMTSGIKNLTITGCEITGAYQVIESRAMENLAITNNTFRGIKARDMLITSDVTNFPDKTYTGYVTVTGNQSFDGEERFVRASLNNSDAVVVIKDNNIYNYQGADADYIKVEGGNNVTIENNTISVGAQDAASAQAALDNAVSGDKIQLQPGVNYGTLTFRANPGHANTTLDDIADAYRYNYNRSIKNITIIGADGAKVDGFKFETGALPGDCNNRVTVNNLVIDGVEFTDALTAAPAGYNAPIMITTSNATIDGLTVKNCKLIGDNSKLNLVYLYGADGSKNVSLINNEVEGVARLCELRGTENVTLTGNVIKNTYEHAMLLAGGGYDGNVTITGNTADGIRDRFVRMAGAGNAVVLIKDNNIYNYQGADADYIKVTDGTNVTIENNVFGRIVYGLTLIPNAENSKIIVKDKEGFLNLTRLFAEWTALFTDGNGNEYDNYASGAGVDYYYGKYWTISLEADIYLNNETISPVILKHPVQADAPTFDGNNHTIKNAKIVTDATTENKAGLFDASDCNLKNLKLDNIHVTGSNVGNSSAGVLSGSVNANVQYITITNSSVTGGKYTGGITGYGYTDVTNCSLTNVTVKGGYKLGGVIGYIAAESGTGDVTGNTLTDCTVDGIGGGVYAGGKSEYIIGKVVGNYNCNGTCSNNTITNMTTSATANIGKVEGSFTVQE